jgi:hypothetical protein
VRTVVDLRAASEVEDAGGLPASNDWPPRVVSVPTDNPAIESLRQAGAADVGRLYLWNLAAKAAGFAKVVALLADVDNLPCVIQCKSGKDRTGIVVALILDLLGVPPAAIAAEYALTEEVLRRLPKASRDAFSRQMIANGLDPEMLHTSAETMDTFIQAFREEYGNAADYARLGGADSTTLDAVRKNLLEARPRCD